MPDRYFEINDDVGINADGNPEPLHEIGVTVSIPTMNGSDVVDVPQRTTVKPIPGTRTFKTDDPIIAQAILDSGLVHETTQLTKAEIKAQRESTEDAREQSGTIDNDHQESAS
jgi:hypothetical protein